MLNEIHYVPEGFLDAKAEELLALLGKPTLIHLAGNKAKPLFISTLLHGNETTGLSALQALLKRYANKALPRALSIFIGNIEAGAQQQRRLKTQQDYNRSWPGTQLDDCLETDLMQAVTHIMRKRKPFASIDVHNNTGHNPHYGCINILNPHGLQLAAMFSNIAVYFTTPKGVQSSAFSDFCPAVVLECGQSGEQDGISHASNYLESVLALDSIPSGHPKNFNIYHTVARIIIPKQLSFSTSEGKHIQLRSSLEQQNFTQLTPGTEFARIQSDHIKPFIVSNESGENICDEFFEIIDKKVRLKRTVVLAMFTSNETAIRQDCLCYLMEHLRIQE